MADKKTSAYAKASADKPAGRQVQDDKQREAPLSIINNYDYSIDHNQTNEYFAWIGI